MFYRLLAAFGLMIFFSSCYQNMHFADRANSPGLSHKGEFKAVAAIKPQISDNIPDTNGSRSAMGGGASPEADLAYAITDHVAVTASYSSVVNRYVDESFYRGWTGKSSDRSVGGLINAHLGELGVGLFDQAGRMFKYGIYLSGGIGTIKRQGFVMPQHNYTANVFKYSLQPEFGFGPGDSKTFSFMAGSRFALYKFFNFKSTNPDTKYVLGDYYTTGGANVTNQSYFYFEPYVNLEMGYKYIKFNMQFGVTLGTGQNSEDIGNTPYISAGIVFHRDPRY